MAALVWSHQGHPVEACEAKAPGAWYTVSLVTYTREEHTGAVLSVQSQAVATFLFRHEAHHYASALAKYSFDCDLVRIS